MKPSYLVPIALALIMSIISSKWLFVGSVLSLIPWGLLALSYGLLAKNKRDACCLGAIYGFTQAFIFLWIDKAGQTSISQFILLFVIISGLATLAAGFACIGSLIIFSVKSKSD